MTFDEYQAEIEQFDVFTRQADTNCTDPAYIAKILGIVGEAGEVAEKYKKIIRDNSGEVTDAHKIELTKELGDVLWYAATLARYLDIPLSEVAKDNIAKLSARKQTNKIHGSGDNR